MRGAWAMAAAALAVTAVPARAGECVRVVVDYGTSAGAGTHCTSADTNDKAYEVLAQRASEMKRTVPRYSSSGFLCAIDGYPGTGCGDHDTEPYWSLWYWQNEKWVYSSQGVTTLVVADRDGDGHPDPMGFRYTPFQKKNAPRANPTYASPTPTRTTAPPATTPPPTRGGTTPARAATNAPTTTPATSSPVVTVTPVVVVDHPAVEPPAPETTEPAPPAAAGGDDRGVPFGAIAAVVAGAVLAGAAVARLRRAP